MSLTPDEITVLAKAIVVALIREIPSLAQPVPVAAAPDLRNRFEIGPLVIDIGRHEVLIDDVEAAVPRREFTVLEALVRNAGTVLSRERLLEIAWPADVALEIENTRNVDVIVRRLRIKLGRHAKLIETVHGSGYKLRDR